MKQYFKKAAGILLCVVIAAASAVFTVSAQEDITADPTTFAVNKDTITATTAASNDQYDYCMVLRKDKYFEYTVHTESAARYQLTVNAGTISDSEQMSVSVNDVSQLENVTLANTGAYGTRNSHEIGSITLAPGANVIKFSSPAGPNGILIISFTLTKLEDVYQYHIPTTKPDDVDKFDIGAGSSPIGWYPADNSECIIMRGNANGNSWVEKEITVQEAGWYGVTVKLGASSQYETGLTLKASVGGKSTSRTVEVTSSYTSYEDRYIGNLYLEEGAQTVRLEVTSKAAFVKSFTLENKLEDDFVNGALNYDISPTMVSSMNGYTEGDADCSYSWCMNLRGSKSFGISVYTEKAISYLITARYGANTAGQSIDVAVNGYKQVEKAPVDVTGEKYPCTDGHVIGIVNLNRGMNEVTFSLGADSNNAVVMDSVQFALADSFQEGVFTAWVQENRVPEYFFPAEANSGFYTAGGQKCATMRATSWVEYDVYTEEERTVNMLIDMASSENITFSASVNGETQISKENIGVPSSGYTAFATVASAGMLTIPAGHSVIRYTQEVGAGNLRSLTFEEADRNEAVITNFAIRNADGNRMPFAVTEGLKGYAVASVKKLGEADDKLMLIIAQYANDTSLVGVSQTTVDVSQMANRETKEFQTEITLKGEGGYVKAFLMREGSFEPLSKAQSYVETKIFPENVLETSVSYELATNVLNNDGENYAEYGIHDADYDVDAIFYDGYKDTKVFAYIGIPKGATPENPVPAMVLVHGGIGKAEQSWVKKWNDLGYAAIAMDLYGCGPEDDSTSYSGSGKKKHPYAGVAPWDFSADFENAGMYQSVINVINAHTLIRGNDCVDASRIGITGISWGGITTTTVCGVDNRFMFAVPVYGCGYLDQCKTYFGSKFDSASQSIAWDPANFAAKAQMPVMLVNSDADQHFSINSSSLTYGVLKDGYLSIHHGLSHSQSAGDSIQQVYDFADNMFKGNNPYIRISNATAENGVLTADCEIPSGTTISGVTMYYINTTELPSDGGSNINWTAVTDYSENGGTVTVNIPAGATYVYASITDNNGAIMSTKFLKVK